MHSDNNDLLDNQRTPAYRRQISIIRIISTTMLLYITPSLRAADDPPCYINPCQVGCLPCGCSIPSPDRCLDLCASAYACLPDPDPCADGSCDPQDPDDDPIEPGPHCNGSPDSPGGGDCVDIFNPDGPTCHYSASFGDAVHMDVATGNVWTMLPIFSARSGGLSDLEMMLRYDSQRTSKPTDLAPGWSHPFGHKIEFYGYQVPLKGFCWDARTQTSPVCGTNGIPNDPCGVAVSPTPPYPCLCEIDDEDQFTCVWHQTNSTYYVLWKIIYTDGEGRQHVFRGPGTPYSKPTSAPAGRGLKLVWNDYDNINGPTDLDEGNYLLNIVSPDGSKVVFRKSDGNSPDPIQLVDARGRITQIVNQGSTIKVESGHGREMTMNLVGARIEEIVDPAGNTTKVTYDTNGDIITIMDANSNAIGFQYDANHRMTRETLKNGTYYDVAYDDTNNIRKILDGQGNLVVRVSCTNGFPDLRGTYKPAGDVILTDANSNAWTYERDNIGRVKKITDPESHFSTFVYGTSGNGKDLLVSKTDERNHTTTFTYNSLQLLTKRTDPDQSDYLVSYYLSGGAKDYVYTQTFPGDRVWTYEYNSDRDTTKIIDPLDETSGGASADAVVTFAYEDYASNFEVGPSTRNLPKRIKKVTRTDGNGHDIVFDYDSRGNLTKVTRGAGALNLVTQFSYDALGRPIRKVVERGDQNLVTRWTYDPVGRLTTETIDSNGLDLATQVSYDGQGNVDRITNPRNVPTDLVYDLRNRMTGFMIDSSGLAMTEYWKLDGNGNLIEYVDANANSTGYSYDDANHLEVVTDAEGYQTVFTNDQAGNPTRIQRYFTTSTSGANVDMELGYDELDRLYLAEIWADYDVITQVIQYAEGSGGGCGCAATPRSGKPYKIEHPNGFPAYFHYDPLDRLVKRVQKVGDTGTPDGDANDSISQFEYDPVGNLTGFTGPENEQATFVYDEADRRTEARLVSSNGDIATTFDYDGADNVSSVGLFGGNVITLNYDGANRLKTASDSIALIVDLEYDANGNVTKRTDANSNAWQLFWDNADRITQVKDPIIEAGTDKYTQYLWDSGFRLERMIDPAGMVSKFQYDKVDQLIKRIEDYGGAGEAEVAYQYDGLGNVASMTDDASNVTTYTYDLASRIESITYPDANTTGTDLVTFIHNMNAGTAGRVYRTDQKGRQTTLSFSELGLIASREIKEGATTLLNDSYTYDRSARMLTADNGFVKVTNTYDAFGRLDSSKQKYLADNLEFTTGYGYNVSSIRRDVTYPSERIVSETYDGRGRLYDVSSGYGVNGGWTYDGANRRTGASLGNGITSVFGHDIKDRLTSITHAKGAADLFKVEYGYDVADNRLFTKNLLNTNRSEQYTYDGRHRLTAFARGTLNGSNAIPFANQLSHSVLPAKQDWANLDSLGNWRESTKRVGLTTTHNDHAVNAANEIESVDLDGGGPGTPKVLTYDANGNLTENPTAPNAGGAAVDGQRYEYGPADRVRKVWRTEGTSSTGDDVLLLSVNYDALNRRVESKEWIDATTGGVLSTPSHTWHVFDGLSVIEEYDVDTSGPTATLAREFVWGGSFIEPVALIDHTDAGDESSSEAEVLHCLTDILGSVVALTNTNGEVVEAYEYDPYGETYISDLDGNGDHIAASYRKYSRFGNPFMWTGQRYDSTTRNYHFWARTFSPQIGRWLQRDPLHYWDGENLYEYVNSIPTFWIDPTGLASIKSGGFVFKPAGVGDHPGGPNHWHVYDGKRQIGIVDENGNWRNVRDPNKVARANRAARRAGLFVGTVAIGILVDEVFGAAATLQDVKTSPFYDKFVAALNAGDWNLAYRLANELAEHATSGCRHRSCVDVYEWLTQIIEKRKKEVEEKTKKEEEEQKESPVEEDKTHSCS